MALAEKVRAVSRLRTALELQRARILSERKGKLKLHEFTPQEKFVGSRIAEFLWWSGKRYPRVVITYEEITQAIFSLGAVPKAGSRQVANVRNAVSRARAVMRSRYKCDIVSEKGIGARATVDSFDTASVSVVREAASFERSCVRFKESADLVNPKELEQIMSDPRLSKEDREEMETVIGWFNETVLKIVKKLPGHTVLALPLPPKA